MADKVHRNSLKPGYKLHWYRIKAVLGQGGFGITYLAHDFNLDEDVAIKEYLPIELAVRDHDFSVHPVSEDRGRHFEWGRGKFIEEARTLARFKHPNIVRVRSVFEENNTAYMVMEYEHGRSLQDILSERKTLEEMEIIKIMLPVMGGLQLVHDAGFIHRDIKPANIFIREDQSPVLLDFGSARQALGVETKTLTSLVSPGYAPFEQYYSSSNEQGPWTDIYGLAATVYRAIIGRAPLDAVDRSRNLLNTGRDTFVSVQELAKGRYSGRFLTAIDYGLSFRREDRPQSLGEWRPVFEAPTSSALLKVDTVTREAGPTDYLGRLRAGVSTLEREGPSGKVTSAAAGSSRVTSEFKHQPELSNVSTRGLPLLLMAIALVGGGWFAWKQFEAHQFRLRWQNEQVHAEAEVEQQRISVERRRKEEQDHWRETQRSNSEAAYRAYLDAWPNGVHVQTARIMAASLEAERRAMELAKQEEAARKARISELLVQAAIDIDARRLTSPKGNNAYEKYMAVLAADGENEDAKAGIKKVTDVYVSLFDGAIRTNAFEDAADYIARIRNIDPDASVIGDAEDRLSNAKMSYELLARKADVQVDDSSSEASESGIQDDDIKRSLLAEGIDVSALSDIQAEMYIQGKRDEIERLAEMERRRNYVAKLNNLSECAVLDLLSWKEYRGMRTNQKASLIELHGRLRNQCQNEVWYRLAATVRKPVPARRNYGREEYTWGPYSIKNTLLPSESVEISLTAAVLEQRGLLVRVEAFVIDAADFQPFLDDYTLVPFETIFDGKIR